VSLALPAVVMGVLGGAFVVWFMSGGHLGAATAGMANANPVIRPAVQSPQIAAAPAMAEAKGAEPVQTPPIDVLIAAMTTALPEPEAAPQAADVLPIALQPTRQITTPAPMTAVVGEPQQISAPRIMPPAPERRPAAPTPLAPQVQTAQAAPVPAPAVAPASRAAPASEAPAAEPARKNFSVVLASVETEAEARAKLGPLKQKFGTALGARRLNYHRTKQDGAFVWHVRSAGLTEADAEAVCEQIEKAGGECVVLDQ